MSDFINRQALCDDLQEYKVHPVSVLSDESEVKGYNNGIDLAISVISEFPSAEPEPKWIPVTEKLPEDSETVLITHKGGVSFGWYNGKYWERGASTKHRPLQTVIAWMPLPEPWRGE